MSQHPFKLRPHHKQHQHIVGNMGDAEMEERGGEKSPVFLFFNDPRAEHRSPADHISDVIASAGQLHDQEQENIHCGKYIDCQGQRSFPEIPLG